MPARRSRSRISSGAVLGLTLAVSFAIYSPALTAEFVSDDRLAIQDHQLVTGPLRPLTIFTTFSWWDTSRADAPGYRPLVTLSFALDRVVSGLDPLWMHSVNVLLHAIVSWLAFMAGTRLGLQRTEALIAALAFAVLPIHSEAVIWTVGRAELMAAAGFAGALVLLLDHRRHGRPGALVLAAVLFLAGLFSKENAVMLLAAPPLAALLLPSPPGARRRDAIATGVLAATLACYLLVRANAGDIVGQAAGDRLDNPLSVLSGGSRLLGALAVLGRYLKLSVLPYPLSVDYSYDALGIGPGFAGDTYVVVAIVACAALAVWAWRRRERREIAFALALSAATYAIISNVVLVIGTAMAERLFYLPTLGLCLALGPALADAAFARRRWGTHALLLIAAAYAAVVLARAPQWSTPVTLFEAAARAYPRSARAHMELGTAYGHAGRTQDAIAAFGRATEIMPEYAAAWYNLGNLHARRAAYDAAVSAYKNALAHAPRLASASYNMAIALMSSGRRSEAVEVLRAAEDATPRDPAIAMSLGDAYLASGRNAEAADAYTRVLALEPRAASARLNRGVALERMAGCEAALADYTAILREQPADRTALSNAISCLQRLGRTDEAGRLAAAARVANQGNGR